MTLPEFACRPDEGFQGWSKFLCRKSAKISCDQQVGFRPTDGLGLFKGANSTGTPKAIETAEP
jgi:hypothetical protein